MEVEDPSAGEDCEPDDVLALEEEELKEVPGWLSVPEALPGVPVLVPVV